MQAYTAMYSHRNNLIYESENEGINRILVYSSVEIINYLLEENKTDVFLRIVEYNGQKVSASILENGFKVFAVFNSGDNEREKMKELTILFREKVMKGEFNVFEF